MRKKILLPVAIALMAFMALSTPLAAAIEGYTRRQLNLGLWVEVWELRAKIIPGTSWYIKWSGPQNSIFGGYAHIESYLKIWDSLGWSWHWGPRFWPGPPSSGEITINYPNSRAQYLYTEFQWVYKMLLWPGYSITNKITLNVNLWVEYVPPPPIS